MRSKSTQTFDIYSQIENSTDINFLKKLEEYVNMDIENIGKDSDIIKKMKADMRNISIEEMEKRQYDGFLKLKEHIQNRIKELEK